MNIGGGLSIVFNQLVVLSNKKKQYLFHVFVLHLKEIKTTVFLFQIFSHSNSSDVLLKKKRKRNKFLMYFGNYE
jgi:hypothetical protein